MRRTSVSFVSSIALLAAMPAAAQQVDQEGADALAAQIPSFLDTIADNAPDLSYSLEGEVLAEPSGNSYRLSLPLILFEVALEVTGTIQPIDATVTPQANGWQRVEWDIPSPIEISNPRADDERATIAFVSEGNDMTFAPEYSVALDGQAGLEDVLVTVEGQEGQIAIDQMGVSIESDEDGGPDLYSSESVFEVAGINIDIPDEVQLQVDDVTVVGATARQRLDLFAELQQSVRGLDPESQAFAEAMVTLLRTHAGEKWIGDADYRFNIENFSAEVDDGALSLESASLSMAALGLDQEEADLGITAHLAGLASPQFDQAFADIIPSLFELDLLATDAPIEAISQELYGVLGEAPNEEELFGPKGRRAGVGGPAPRLDELDPLAFLGIMMSSNVELELRNFFVDAPIGYIGAEGTVQPDASAALQATADLDLVIAGLPDMIAFAQQMGGEAAEVVGLVAAIAAMGRDETDFDGNPIKAFDLELTQSGQILLNGNDMSAMMGMFQ